LGFAFIAKILQPIFLKLYFLLNLLIDFNSNWSLLCILSLQLKLVPFEGYPQGFLIHFSKSIGFLSILYKFAERSSSKVVDM